VELETLNELLYGEPEVKLIVMVKGATIRLLVSNPNAPAGESNVIVSGPVPTTALSRKPPVKPPPASMLKNRPEVTGVE
jgi:hypothetical protein